jgi:hypothetical protein
LLDKSSANGWQGVSKLHGSLMAEIIKVAETCSAAFLVKFLDKSKQNFVSILLPLPTGSKWCDQIWKHATESLGCFCCPHGFTTIQVHFVAKVAKS